MSPGVTSIFKIIIIGDQMVGKTTLRLRYIGEGFRKQYVATLGTDFAIATHKDYILQIWDLAGQEEFRNVIKSMYVGAHGVILVFDVTVKTSLIHLSKWIDRFLEIEKHVVPMVIIGNKIDLRNESDDCIKTHEAVEHVNELSRKYFAEMTYIETSAMTGENIKVAFESLVEKISLK